jgi:hypothetical protein
MGVQIQRTGTIIKELLKPASFLRLASQPTNYLLIFVRILERLNPVLK